MFDWILSVIDGFGLTGLFGLMLLENVFPPIPSELVIPLAGFLAAQGAMALVPAFLAATAGATAGALFWYYAGHLIGRDRLRTFAARRGRWIGFTTEDLDAAERWFDRHGDKVVLFGRMVPGIRTFVSIPAGLAGMPLPRFLGLTVAGSAVWTALLLGAGYLLDAQYERVAGFVDPVSKGVIVLIVLGYLWQVLRPRGRKAQARDRT
jgi:membrane protein DedA with SNARE-associated domain